VLAYLNVAAVCTRRSYADKCVSKLLHVWCFVVTISKNYKKGISIKLFAETNIKFMFARGNLAQRESAQALDGSKIGKVAVNTTGCLNGVTVFSVDRDISVGTTTRYRLDGSGFELRWRKPFLKPSRQALGPTQWVQGLNKEDKLAEA
jgi:hypothetical protein